MDTGQIWITVIVAVLVVVPVAILLLRHSRGAISVIDFLKGRIEGLSWGGGTGDSPAAPPSATKRTFSQLSEDQHRNIHRRLLQIDNNVRQLLGSTRLKELVRQQYDAVIGSANIDADKRATILSGSLALTLSRQILSDARELFRSDVWPGKNVNVSLKTLHEKHKHLLRCYYPLDGRESTCYGKPERSSSTRIHRRCREKVSR